MDLMNLQQRHLMPLSLPDLCTKIVFDIYIEARYTVYIEVRYTKDEEHY